MTITPREIRDVLAQIVKRIATEDRTQERHRARASGGHSIEAQAREKSIEIRLGNLSVPAHERQIHRLYADGPVDLDIALIVLVTGDPLELLAMSLESTEVGCVIARRALHSLENGI
jgi:hypothetical protein